MPKIDLIGCYLRRSAGTTRFPYRAWRTARSIRPRMTSRGSATSRICAPKRLFQPLAPRIDRDEAHAFDCLSSSRGAKGLGAPDKVTTSSSRARDAATYSSERSRILASSRRSCSAGEKSRSGMGIEPSATPNSATLETQCPWPDAWS